MQTFRICRQRATKLNKATKPKSTASMESRPGSVRRLYPLAIGERYIQRRLLSVGGKPQRCASAGFGVQSMRHVISASRLNSRRQHVSGLLRHRRRNQRRRQHPSPAPTKVNPTLDAVTRIIQSQSFVGVHIRVSLIRVAVSLTIRTQSFVAAPTKENLTQVVATRHTLTPSCV